MTRKPPRADIDESDLEIGHGAHAAAGVTAVAVAMKRAVEQMGVLRTAKTLRRLNQVDGFDCQGCAWPDPDPEHRHVAERRRSLRLGEPGVPQLTRGPQCLVRALRQDAHHGTGDR